MVSKVDFIANSSGSGTITLDIPTLDGSNTQSLYLPDGSGQISRKTNTVIYTSVANSPNNFVIPIPDFAKVIDILFDNVGLTWSTAVRLSVYLGTDSGFEEADYDSYSIAHTASTSNVQSAATNSFIVRLPSTWTSDNFSGVMKIGEVGPGIYVSEHMGLFAAGDYAVGGGTKVMTGNNKATQLKISTSTEASGSIYQGNVKVTFEG